ncbi:hypothetical protein [Mycobacterium paraintracellulare]|uniref:hypothetical protein n=1 Tax=Mycobacterium paraintracellulare TaxID=1138383 RepID=UPI00191699A4|nr:hypothetical protein [Mycobacterium paraintracellulare]
MTALLCVDRRQVIKRVSDITSRVALDDLTDVELVGLLALVEPVDERINARRAPVLHLVPGSRRGLSG